MSGKQDIRAYVNPFVPGRTETGQKAAVSGEVYIEDRSGKQIDALIRSVRKGSVVEVEELYCLAPGKGRADKRRRVMVERIETIKARGARIREAETGLQLPGKGIWMLMRAYEQIATSGRARKRDVEGRPPHPWTPHELGVMEAVWFSRRYKNDDERLTAIEQRIGKRPGRTWLRNKLGSPHKRAEES